MRNFSGIGFDQDRQQHQQHQHEQQRQTMLATSSTTAGGGGGGASRQKSCNACVRSKRRCDKTLPTCTRCTKKGFVCLYGGSGGQSADAVTAGFEAADLVDLGAELNMDIDGDALDFSAPLSGGPGSGDLDVGLDGGGSSSDGPAVNFQFDTSLETLLSGIQTGAKESDIGWLLGGGGLTMDSPIFGAAKGLDEQQRKSLVPARKDYTNMPHMCDEYQPWQMSDPTSKAFFTAKTFREVCPQFARDSCTPYQHPALYRDASMPQWVLNAWTTAHQYVSHTSANRGMALRVLHDNVTHLHETASGGAGLTPREKLARLHALLVYQLIRMFDGDITLNSQADADFAVLEGWLWEVGKVRDNLQEESLLGQEELRGRAPESWERWVFAESMRRTCVMSYSLITFWELLRGTTKTVDYKNASVGVWAQVHRWTLSKHLWEASDSFEFFRAWKEKPFWVVSGFNYEEFLRTGTGDDIDDFARIFLTIWFGGSAIKGFIHDTSTQRVE